MVDVTDYFEGGLEADDKSGGFDNSPVPEGHYQGKILNASPEANGENWKDPEGEHLSIEIEIVSSESKGRHLWKNITLTDKNSEFVEWGKQDLMRLMNAVGIGSLTKFEQLIGKVVEFDVEINGSYNNIKRWAVAKEESKPTQSNGEDSSSEEKNPWD